VNETFLNGRLIVKTGDLTAEDADAIVNAANSSLMGGGGVDGAIHAKGGPSILEECRRVRYQSYPDGLPTGKAVITTAGDLPARFVIHTVGPIYGENRGRDAELLAECYRNSMRLAVDNGLRSIAFASISTGVYHYPKIRAATVVGNIMAEELPDLPGLEVRLVFHTLPDTETFLEHSGLT
jgi:O-acetyl-ADP-ribose deacetylase